MQIDLTKVETSGKVDYEIELEIIDVNYFLQKLDDIMGLRKLVRKFLLN